jgi:hypothetical protein
MSRRLARAIATVLAGGLALSLASAAAGAPVGGLKFKVPTANSNPRAITNGSDGNRWFTEGTEFTSAPAKIARITAAGGITEFAPDVADGCNFCIITDIAQWPGNILYITSNDPTLMRLQRRDPALRGTGPDAQHQCAHGRSATRFISRSCT